LTLDNSEKEGPFQFKELDIINVKRRIAKDKGSRYFINDKEMRARDIQTLFADLSTGAHSPSMISQGKIGALVTAKPTDRRAILEEAAGISGIHVRRHESELRLNSAENNLRKADELRRQQEKQLANLQKQAEEATKYKIISEEIKKIEAGLYYLRLKDIDHEMKLENEINILEERMQSLISEHDFSHWNKFHGYLQNNNDTLKQIDDIEKSHLTIYDYDIYDRFIEDYKIFLNKFNEFLQWSDDLRKTFNDAINNVLKRFVMTEGLQQVNIIASDDDNNRRFYEIEALENDHVGHSKRKREHFSEGQKAQIATAWMITQRELAHAASNYICFPHRIIILDDPSATFDMTNLHSQAILLRQLAYHPDPEKRYQLFIVSHHEGFTSKLLDLLCPPEGCSMKLLRFKNWTPKEGPEVELFEVEQTPGSCLSDLEATLKDAFDLYKETV